MQAKYYVEYTLILSTSTLLPGNVNIVAGGSPSAIIYDPNNGYIYVADAGTNVVYVIDPNTNHIIDKIPVGNEPIAMFYDSKNGYIYMLLIMKVDPFL